MKTYETLDLTAPGLVLGNHGIWDPKRALKIPFQFGGFCTKRTRNEARGSRDTIVDEISIMRALAEKQMAPPIGEVVFFKNVISRYPYDGDVSDTANWHCDPCGAYAYEMADATKLPPGKFDIDKMSKLLPIVGSPGAWGDVRKPDNTVNGYLVDVRRSVQDLLHWQGKREPLPDARENRDELRARVHRNCQFPQGERAEAYQDFWLDGNIEHGQRRVIERARQLGLQIRPGDTVLDIGTQSGSFLQFAWMNGATKCAGVEIDPLYVECARSLARSCGQNICIREMDVVAQRAAFVAWVKAYFPTGVSHLCALSMEKHLGEDFLFSLIDEIGAKTTYIETNAVAKDGGFGPEPDIANAPMKLWPEVEKRRGVYVGSSRDRNLRRLYRIART